MPESAKFGPRQKSIALRPNGTLDRGVVWGTFETMRIKHPRLKEAHDCFDDLRTAARLSPDSPRRYASLFAPTHSGKTMAVRTYIEQRVVPELVARGELPAGTPAAVGAALQKKVLHVTLSGGATPRSLASDILRALKDPRADRGTKDALLGRVYNLLRDVGVELLVIDEIQHLTSSVAKAKDASERSGFIDTTVVADTLKAMLIRGLVPMVFVGISVAQNLLLSDRQILGRRYQELDFSELDWADAGDRKIFEDYCGRVGLKIAQHGLVEKDPNFLADTIPACLFAASQGVIGYVSRIAEEATIHALQRDKGPKTVTYDDLSMAVQTLAIPNRMIDYNPFTDGIRQTKVRKLAA